LKRTCRTSGKLLLPQALDHLASVTSLVNKPSLELRSFAVRF